MIREYNINFKEGHKYLFSEIKHNWVDAAAECELYGGWLVNIESLAEQNCLVRYGNTHGLNAWYWTDGNLYLSIYMIFKTPMFHSANDIDSRHVWVHASI